MGYLGKLISGIFAYLLKGIWDICLFTPGIWDIGAPLYKPHKTRVVHTIFSATRLKVVFHEIL